MDKHIQFNVNPSLVRLISQQSGQSYTEIVSYFNDMLNSAYEYNIKSFQDGSRQSSYRSSMVDYYPGTKVPYKMGIVMFCYYPKNKITMHVNVIFPVRFVEIDTTKIVPALMEKVVLDSKEDIFDMPTINPRCPKGLEKYKTIKKNKEILNEKF